MIIRILESRRELASCIWRLDLRDDIVERLAMVDVQAFAARNLHAAGIEDG